MVEDETKAETRVETMANLEAWSTACLKIEIDAEILAGSLNS